MISATSVAASRLARRRRRKVNLHRVHCEARHRHRRERQRLCVDRDLVLQRGIDGSDVTANCFHPGAVATRLGQTDATWTRLVGRVVGLFMLTPEQGASTGVFLATAPEAAHVSGRYFAKSRERKPAAYAQDDAAARRLWDASEKLIAGLV